MSIWILLRTSGELQINIFWTTLRDISEENVALMYVKGRIGMLLHQNMHVYGLCWRIF
ncbi:hypothetical protein GLYMA_09G030800v4 [Glycine max]|uniref:Uncharacterized protein n=1 Tax=Glycine max TaxID=3847 RepID=A0A0R0I948_SOYBN|nr:hypothetical protein GLYMA_09G030800v4 [Glycine max]